MSEQTWTVYVDGVAHQIEIAPVKDSDKTQVRVDGRMAARPIPPEEESCEFPVGSARYILLRNEGHDWELREAWSPPPPSMGSRSRPAATPAVKTSSGGIPAIIIVVGVAMLLLVGGIIFKASRDSNRDWTAYDDPTGHFTVEFPGLEPPVREDKTQSVEGVGVHTVVLHKFAGRQEYILGFYDVSIQLDSSQGSSLVDGLIKDFAREAKGEASGVKPAKVGGRDARAFTVTHRGPLGIPVTIHGRILFHRHRYYILATEAWMPFSRTTPRDRFFASLNLKLPDSQPTPTDWGVLAPVAGDPPPQMRGGRGRPMFPPPPTTTTAPESPAQSYPGSRTP